MRIVWVFESTRLQKMTFPGYQWWVDSKFFTRKLSPTKWKKPPLQSHSRFIISHWHVTMGLMKQTFVSNWRMRDRNGKIAWYLGRNERMRDYREKCVKIDKSATTIFSFWGGPAIIKIFEISVDRHCQKSHKDYFSGREWKVEVLYDNIFTFVSSPTLPLSFSLSLSLSMYTFISNLK